MSNIKFTPVRLPSSEDGIPYLDWYISEVEVTDGDTGALICRLQQGVGHCCGATFITQMQPSFPTYIVELLVKIKRSPRGVGLRWQVQKQLFLYLSDETVLWDEAIRKRPDIEEVYTFKNFTTKPYTGSDVTLFVLELE